MPGQGQVRVRLGGGRRPDHRDREPGTCQRTREPERSLPVRQEEGREDLHGRQRRDPQHRLGDDPEPALGTQHELPEVRAGRRGRMRRHLQRPGRRLQRPTGEERLDPTEPN